MIENSDKLVKKLKDLSAEETVVNCKGKVA